MLASRNKKGESDEQNGKESDGVQRQRTYIQSPDLKDIFVSGGLLERQETFEVVGSVKT